jgi:hypothetical protein
MLLFMSSLKMIIHSAFNLLYDIRSGQLSSDADRNLNDFVR